MMAIFGLILLLSVFTIAVIRVPFSHTGFISSIFTPAIPAHTLISLILLLALHSLELIAVLNLNLLLVFVDFS